jgi:hypothetical protein
MLNSTLFAQAVIEGEPGAHSLLLLLFILVLQLKRGRGGHEVLSERGRGGHQLKGEGGTRGAHFQHAQ